MGEGQYLSLETAPCESLTEEEVALKLSVAMNGSDEDRLRLPRWYARCCHLCSGKLHSVLRKCELMQIADTFEAFRAAEAAAALERRLLALPPERGPEAVRRQTELWNRALAVRLLLAEERLRFECPRDGLRYAALAREIAERLAEAAGHHPHLAAAAAFANPRPASPEIDLLVLTLSRLANACRYNSNLPEAREHSQRALFIMKHTQVSRLVAAEVTFLHGAILTDAGEATAGEAALERSIRLFNQDPHRRGLVRVKLAANQRLAGGPPEKYMSTLERAVADMDALRDPEAVQGTNLNRIFYLVEMDQLERARAAWNDLGPAVSKTTEGRLYAVGASIDLAAGRLEDADRGFISAIQTFEHLGKANDAAVCMLYRGEALLLRERRNEAHTLLTTACSVFQAAKISQRALVALKRLNQSLQEGAERVEVIERLRVLAAHSGGCLRPTQRHP